MKYQSSYNGICATCKKDFVGFWNRKRKPPQYCSRLCMAKGMKGKKLSKEHKENLRIAMIGKQPPKTAFKSGDKRIMRGGSIWKRRVGKQKAENHPNWKGGIKVYRKRALRHYGKKCMLCGYDENPLALEVHHRDGNHNNPSIDNLMVVCANCHRIETYKK